MLKLVKQRKLRDGGGNEERFNKRGENRMAQSAIPGSARGVDEKVEERIWYGKTRKGNNSWVRNANTAPTREKLSR